MRRTTALMSQWKADTQSGESLHFELCKGGYFSDKDEYGLKVVGKTAQNGTPIPDMPVEIQCVKAGSKITVCGKNILDISDKANYSLVKCIVNNGHTINSYIVNSYFCGLTFTKGMILQACKTSVGSKLTFSIEGNPSDANLSIVISGYKSGKLYSAENSSRGNSVSMIIPDSFDDIVVVELRFNRRSAPFTDTSTVFSKPQLEFEDVSPYEPYTGGEITVPCDLYEGDIWYPVTGKVIKSNGVIAQYDGEAVDTAYISTTGELSVGARVVYSIPKPVTEQYAPLIAFAPAGTVNVLQMPMELCAELSATMLTLGGDTVDK